MRPPSREPANASLVVLAVLPSCGLQHQSSFFSPDLGSVGLATATLRTRLTAGLADASSLGAATGAGAAPASVLTSTLRGAGRRPAPGGRAAGADGRSAAGRLGRRSSRSVAQGFALVDPDLHADHAVGRLGLGDAVVDVGTQRVQRHPTFAVPLGTRDLDSVQASRAHDLDTLSAQPHCVLHGPLHSAPEHDPLFQLLSNRVGDQLRVELGLADLVDVHVHRHAHHLLQRDLQRLDVLALLADHHPWPGRIDGDARVLGRALDQNPPDRGVAQLAAQVLAHLQVLAQHPGKFAAAGEPARVPVARDRESKTGRIDLLAHDCPTRSCRRRPRHRCGSSSCRSAHPVPWRAPQSGAASVPAPPKYA